MTRIYKRLYELTISAIKREDIPDYSIPPLLAEPTPTSTSNYDKSTQVKVVITELHIEATISKNKGTSADTLDISIYNLSNKYNSILDADDVFIELKAGYESLQGDNSNLPIVFVGQLSNYEISKSGNSTITRITAGDGISMLKNEKVTYDIKSGAKVADVISDLAHKFRNVSDVVLGLEDVEGEVFETGYSAYGSLKTILREVCESRGLTFNFHNNSLFVHPDGWRRVNDLQVGILDPEDIGKNPSWSISTSKAQEGLLTSKVITVTPSNTLRAKKLGEKRVTRAKEGKETFGVLVEIPAQTEIDINRSKVKLVNDESVNKFSDDIVGDYTIESIDINLQLKDGDWSITMELTRVDTN